MNGQSTRDLALLVRRIENVQALDRVSQLIEPLARRLTRNDNVKRTLSGTQLGHRLHPMLTDVPIGCWTSATLIDLAGGRAGHRAARMLVGAGIVASIPTVASGLSDWEDTYGSTRRIGTVHAIGNATGVVLQLASFRARARGRHARGALLGITSLGVLTFAGYLGGHLVYVERAGVDHEVPVVDDDEWHAVARTSELDEGGVLGVTLHGARIALVRDRGSVYALAAVCSHAGGPLDEGKVHDGALVCPWHGSAFCLDNGAVERGPATTPQPIYETRIRGTVIEVRVVEITRLHAAV
jgi:nitrite reductase/ring-hydroxylating ferredoxin subunit/uncharacterized membrane protein